MKARITVTLEIEGDPADAQWVVDKLLDAGFFQDAINDHDVEDAGPLHVTSATAQIADVIHAPTLGGSPT